MGAALAQYIPEQNLFEFSGGDMGLLDVSGDLHRLTGGGGVQQGLGLGHVEPGTCLLRRDGVGGGVIACVFHAAGHGVVDALGGEGLGGQNRGVHIHRAIGLGGEGIPDGLLQIRLGHRQTVQFPGHRQAVLAHLIRGVLSGTGEGLGQLRELLTKHSPVRLQIDALGALTVEQVGQEGPTALEKAGLPLRAVIDRLGVSGVVHILGDAQGLAGDGGGRLRVIERLALRRGDAVSALVRQRQVKRHRSLGKGAAQLLAGLLDRHARHIYTVDGGVGEKDVQGCGVGTKPQICGGQYGHQNSNDDQRFFSGAAAEALSTVALCNGFFCRLLHEALPFAAVIR